MLLTVVVSATSQGQQKFDPDKFQADMRKFITDRAMLTEDEATKVFPMFLEMKAKERKLFESQRKGMKMPQTDEDFKQAIENYDKIDFQVKTLQKNYHLKFLKVLPAKKVFLVIRADDDFKKMMFRNMARPNFHKGGMRPQHKK